MLAEPPVSKWDALLELVNSFSENALIINIKPKNAEWKSFPGPLQQPNGSTRSPLRRTVMYCFRSSHKFLKQGDH